MGSHNWALTNDCGQKSYLLHNSEWFLLFSLHTENTFSLHNTEDLGQDSKTWCLLSIHTDLWVRKKIILLYFWECTSDCNVIRSSSLFSFLLSFHIYIFFFIYQSVKSTYWRKKGRKKGENSDTLYLLFNSVNENYLNLLGFTFPSINSRIYIQAFYKFIIYRTLYAKNPLIPCLLVGLLPSVLQTRWEFPRSLKEFMVKESVSLFQSLTWYL